MMTAQVAFDEVMTVAENIKTDKLREFPEAASIGDTFRQGDIYITLIEKLPEECKVVQNPSNQIAIGDTQGSRHCIKNIRNVTVYNYKSPTMLQGPIIKVNTPTVITHPEHGHVKLPCGLYDITYQRNLDSEEREMRARD